MITLGLLLTKEHRLLSVAAILDVFESVNRFCARDGKAPYFDIHVVTQLNGQTLPGNYRPETLPQEKMDIIFIPAFATDDIPKAIQENIACIPWLRAQYGMGAELASFLYRRFFAGRDWLVKWQKSNHAYGRYGIFFQRFPSGETGRSFGGNRRQRYLHKRGAQRAVST